MPTMNTTKFVRAQAPNSVCKILSNLDSSASPPIAKYRFGRSCCSLTLGDTKAETPASEPENELGAKSTPAERGVIVIEGGRP